jgi:hypothetical protein
LILGGISTKKEAILEDFARVVKANGNKLRSTPYFQKSINRLEKILNSEFEYQSFQQIEGLLRYIQ